MNCPFLPAAAAALCLFAVPSLAQTTAPTAAETGWGVGLQEVRLGGALSSIELHPYSIFVPNLSSFDPANLDSVTFDALFRTPHIAVFDWLGSPRLELGAVLNLRGRENVVHAGLNWHLPVFETPLFLEMSWGVGFTDAALEGAAKPFRNVGCNPLVHWSMGVGAEIDANWNVVARLQHVSHALLCGNDVPNEGVNNFGIALGYKF